MIREQSNDPQWPTLVVTGGNLLFEQEHLTPSNAGTAKITAKGILQACQKMGADFAGIGTRDLAAGIAFLKASHQPPAFNWLSLNLVDPATHMPLFTPMVQRQVGSTKIAVLALTGQIDMANDAKEFLIQNWRTALPPVLAKAEQEADFIVLLSNYSFNENQEIAKEHGSIDLILQTGHVVGNRTPFVTNKSLITQTEIRGKYVGILDIDWQGRTVWSEKGQPRHDGDQPVSTYANQFVPLYQSLPVAPEIEAVVKLTKLRIERLRQGQTP